MTVHDSGTGISAEKIRELEGADTGTGLGTQIVKTLVASELNGTIHWSLAPEGGTLVTIEAAIL